MPQPIGVQKDDCIPGVTQPVCQAPPLPVCTAPARLICLDLPGSNPPAVQCFCAQTGGPHPQPEDEKLCTASLVYQRSNPPQVYLAAREPQCDGAGLEIAIAVLLAKLMTSAPLP